LLVIVLLVAVPMFANHGWSTYHWSKPGSYVAPPVVMNVGAPWDGYASRVMADWNSSAVINSPWSFGAISSRKQCTSTTGKIEVCNAAYGQRGWLGIAGISLSGGHIVKGYTKLNDSYYTAGGFYDTFAWRQMVYCQEVGHDYGLGHQNEIFNNVNVGSCMDYTNAPQGGTYNGFNYGPANLYPNAHDYDQLLIQYNHNDAVSLPFDEMVKDATRPTTIEEYMNKAEQWGEPIAFDAEGRPTTFFLKTGTTHNGEHGPTIDGEVTDIFWAPFPIDEEGHGEKGVRQ
jgi:hypothetical protein